MIHLFIGQIVVANGMEWEVLERWNREDYEQEARDSAQSQGVSGTIKLFDYNRGCTLARVYDDGKIVLI